MSEHTPGPWQNYHWIIRHPVGGTDEDGVPFTEVVATASNNANARLIAAAPDLLEALEEAEAALSWPQSFYNDVVNTAPEYIERCGDWNAVQYMLQDCESVRQRLRAAIAKAKPGT